MACMRSIRIKVTKMDGWYFLGFTAFVTVTDVNGQGTVIPFPGNPVTDGTLPWNAGAEPNGPCTLVAQGGFTNDLRVAEGRYDPALLVTAPQSNVRESSTPVAVFVDNRKPSWTPDTPISGGRMLNPQNQTVTPITPSEVVVCAGGPLPCAVEAATDNDKLTPIGCGTPDTRTDPIRYKWEATTSTGLPVNGFADANSRITSWTAPSASGDYILTCRIDDPWDDTPPGAVTGASAGEVGNRNDPATVRQVTVTVTNDEVFKIIVDGSNPPNPGPAYTAINASVTLRAVPSLGTTFAAGAPTWLITEQPAGSSLTDPPGGATATLNPQVIGKYVIVAGCESFTLYCIKVTFTEDLGQAYGFDDFSVGGPFKSVEVGHSDTAFANVEPPDATPGAWFKSDNIGVMTIAPIRGTIPPQLVTVTGFGKGEATARATADSVNGPLAGQLGVFARLKLTKTVAVRLVNEENDDVQLVPVGTSTGPNGICVSPGTNGEQDTVPGGDDTPISGYITSGNNQVCETTANNTNVNSTDVSDADIQAWLDKAYRQAIVTWEITRLPAKAVNWDLNRDQYLGTANPLYPGAYLATDEMQAIWPACEDTNYDINVMLVDNPKESNLRGQSARNGRSVFVFGNMSTFEAQVTAHEIGHAAFGLSDLDTNNSSDIDNLMWGIAGTSWRLRINQWRQINPYTNP